MAVTKDGRVVPVKDGDIILYQDWWRVQCRWVDDMFVPMWANSNKDLYGPIQHKADLVRHYNGDAYRLADLETATQLRLEGKITSEAYHYFLERNDAIQE